MASTALPELLGLSYSTWSEKAKWALDARRVPYTYRQYAPLLGELALRRKVGRWSGVVTVPVLTDVDGKVYNDSEHIARWADARGEGPALFPAGKDADIEHYMAPSERGLSAGRILGLHRMLANREAMRAMVPRALRATLGPAAAV